MENVSAASLMCVCVYVWRLNINIILTRHLWGIEETTLDEAVPCWAFAFAYTFTLSEFLKQRKDHVVKKDCIARSYDAIFSNNAICFAQSRISNHIISLHVLSML